MSVIHYSNGPIDRNAVFDYLEKKRAVNPGYKVIDLGGSANPWCDKYVDAYVDYCDVPGKKIYKGDLQSEALWEELAREKWDFCICTHVLEDIRDPRFVIDKITKHFKGGFISVPNKHTEMSHIESPLYLGYCHHRWIFTLAENNILRAIAKFPIVQLFSPNNSWYHKLAYVIKLKRMRHPSKTSLAWLKPEIAGRAFELAFIWEDGFDFNFINNDFAGINSDELIKLYSEDLAHGL